VRNIVTFDGNFDSAGQGESVTLELADEIDISRGDMLVSPAKQPTASTIFASTLVWMSEKPLVVGQSYLAKHTTRSVKARVTNVRHRVDVNTLAHESADALDMNSIAVVDIEASQPLLFDVYEESRATGSFILIDPISNATVAAGMILEDCTKSAIPAASPDYRVADSTRPVTGIEKFERHGHLPAAFLLPDAAVESVERALFAAGFETIALRGDLLGRESFFKVFHLLYSAGFVILASDEVLDAEAKQELHAGRSKQTVFDISAGLKEISNGELIAMVLNYADSLRLGTARENGE
jgi:sulfate adenylyltransferase subunit 1